MPQGSYDSRADWLTSPPPRQPSSSTAILGVTHESRVRGDAELHAKNTRAGSSPGSGTTREDARPRVLARRAGSAPRHRAVLRPHERGPTTRSATCIAWLDAHGLAQNTVGLPVRGSRARHAREKRWVYDSGIHVPLLVRWPGRCIGRLVCADELVAVRGLRRPQPARSRVAGGERGPIAHAGGTRLPRPRPLDAGARIRLRRGGTGWDETFDSTSGRSRDH
jgi:hypothetical protein